MGTLLERFEAKGSHSVGPAAWVFVCAGCDGLSSSRRSDLVACSAASLKKARRSGRIRQLRAIAAKYRLLDERTGKPQPALVAQAIAIRRLRPDLEDEMRRGALSIPDVMQAVYERFTEVLLDKLEASREAQR